MWIFAKHGFISVVQDRNDPARLLVRARKREDLENLDISGDVTSEISETPDADYRFRIFVPRKAFAAALQRMALAIDYTNFKTAVHGVPDRDSAYFSCWAAMRRFQEGVNV